MRTVSLLLAALTILTSCASVDRTPTTSIALTDFFQRPVGPRGLEPTPQLLHLDGQRVTVSGYIVREEEPTAGAFMLAPVPTSLAEVADGPADYLPGATLFVSLPAKYADRRIQFRPGVWHLTGTLQLGARNEPNGRVSYVRLILADVKSIEAPNDAKPVLYVANDNTVAHSH